MHIKVDYCMDACRWSDSAPCQKNYDVIGNNFSKRQNNKT